MNLKRSLSGGIAKLLRQADPAARAAAADAVPPAKVETETPDTEPVTARIARKHREQGIVDAALATALAELWQAVGLRLAADPDAALSATRMAELSERLESLRRRGDPPGLETCVAMVAVLAHVVPERLDLAAGRLRELADGSREIQRKVSQHELRSSHLRDELDRCRTLIDQECAHRGLPHIAADPLDLHARLARLLADQTPAPASATANDPLISVLESLIASNDADALRTLPDWVKRPAARILELIAERNRYRRLLEHAGMLPPPPRN